MKIEFLNALLVAFIFAGLFGCANSQGGLHSPLSQKVSRSVESRGNVSLPRDFSEEGLDEYIPDLVKVLKRHGFTPVAKGGARYSTSFYLGGGFGMESTITLYDKGVPIVTGKSSNPGFGTWIARPLVSGNLFQASLQKFDKALYSMDVF